MHNEYFFLEEIDFLDSFSIIKDNILLVKIKITIHELSKSTFDIL